MMYKVYSQNIVKPTRIIKATQADLDLAMNEIMDEAIRNNFIEANEDGDIDDQKWSEALAAIDDFFKEKGRISSGDYEIIKADSICDITIPNVCISDAREIFCK